MGQAGLSQKGTTKFLAIITLLLLAGCGDFWASIQSVSSTSATQIVYGTVNVAPVYPTNGANWMDYVSNSGGGGTAYTRNDTACAGTELNYFGCLHGGELKKFVATGQSSCTGLTAQDSLGAFNWFCSSSTNPVTFYSRGLNTGMGLKNLITSSGWISNYVTVYSGGVAVFQTPSSTWWSNSITALPTNPNSTDAPILLSSSGTIYYQASSTTTSGYDLNGASSNKIAIVTLGSSILSYSGYTTNWCVQNTGAIGAGSKAILCGGSAKYDWIEVTLKGATQTVSNAIYLGNSIAFNRLRNVEIIGNSKVTNGITLEANAVNSNQSSMIDGSKVHDVSGVGFNTLNQSNYDTIMNSIASNNGSYGFWLGANLTASRKLIYNDISTNNAGGGFEIDLYDQYFSVIQATAANNAVEGFGMAGNYGMYQAITSTQNQSYQFFYHSAGNPYSEVFNNLALISANGTAVGMYLQSNNSTYVGDVLAAYSSVGIQNDVGAVTFLNDGLLVGQNTTNCTNTGGDTTLDTSCNHGSGLSTAAQTGVNPVSSFVGIPTGNDVVNSSTQTIATATYPPSDWVNFQNNFRGWGLGVPASLFNASIVGTCVSTKTCQIYDWSLKSTDTLMLNYYGAFPTNGGACPSSVDATNSQNVLINFDSTPIHYLRAAIEIMDPTINPNGNYNGVCESGEACLYTPNLGAYQGTGDFTTLTCSPFKGGNGVTGVILYAYPNNGL